jgi:hypothetical protein
MNRHLILLLLVTCGVTAAQDNPPMRLRGTVDTFAAPNLVIQERNGRRILLILPETTGIVEVIPSDITAIQPGSFVGAAALPRADGRLQALEVVVFPEAARGSGEGHFQWDLKPDSSMTNATVTDLARSSEGRRLMLRYGDGEQEMLVPDGVPIVTLGPGKDSLIVPGAKVFIVAEPEQDRLIVRRLLIGRNGLQPPM